VSVGWRIFFGIGTLSVSVQFPELFLESSGICCLAYDAWVRKRDVSSDGNLVNARKALTEDDLVAHEAMQH